jgi:hypothetical protein
VTTGRLLTDTNKKQETKEIHIEPGKPDGPILPFKPFWKIFAINCRVFQKQTIQALK